MRVVCYLLGQACVLGNCALRPFASFRSLGSRRALSLTHPPPPATARQLDSASERQFQGTGLGLAVSSQLSAQLGGRLEGSSAGLAKGATFTLFLPLVDPPPRPARLEEGEGWDKAPAGVFATTIRSAQSTTGRHGAWSRRDARKSGLVRVARVYHTPLIANPPFRLPTVVWQISIVPGSRVPM